MSTATARSTDTRVFRVYIKASQQKVWDAITQPEWNQKYGYLAPSHYDLKLGGKFTAVASPAMEAAGAKGTIIDGEVLVSDPPRKLVQTWRALWEPNLVKEGFTRLTWDLEDSGNGLTRLTVTHDLTDAPNHAAQVAGDLALDQGGGGWAWILSDLKTFLESGQPMAG